MEHSPDTPRSCFSVYPLSHARAVALCSMLSLVCFFSLGALADGRGASLGILDGKTFQSHIGLKGQPADVDDVLVFEDGQFVSQECERSCGYAKVDYWVRAHGDAIQMRAEVPCTTQPGAIMRWQATIRGDVITGSFTWTNRRWYWTFEKEFWFEGRLVEAESP